MFLQSLDNKKDVQEYLNKIIECGDALEENKKAMQETFTGMSFDAFFDSFKSLVTDMSSTFSDMTDEFGENLRKSILENLLANKYKERLQTLYDDWVKAADSDGNGTFDLDASESAALRESQKALAEEIIRERDALAEALRSGKLGELKRSVWIITNWYRTQYYYDSGSWRATWEGEGGGVLALPFRARLHRHRRKRKRLVENREG